MKSIIEALEKIRKMCDNDKFDTNGFIIGEKWILDKKENIPKCLISSRITRKVIALASQEDIKLIISIYPPIFTKGIEQKIDGEQLDILKIILENKISLYALGKKWLIAENGGFDYLLDLFEFEYKSLFELSTLNQFGEEIKINGRFGERKKKLKLKDLLFLCKELVDQEISYLGYNDLPIKNVIIINEIMKEEIIQEIIRHKKIDLVIVGEMSYEALLSAQLVKLPIMIIGKSNLENIIISKIRRYLMEEVTINLPEIQIKKQDKIGTIYQ